MSQRYETINDVTDTARLVAIYRAMESERPDALFHDPYARRLAGPGADELPGQLPGGKRGGMPIAIRTLLVDEMLLAAVQRSGITTVLSLGAGLDARPYRLPLPPGLQWIEVDFPRMMAYKTQALAGETPHCRRDVYGVDLADGAARREFLQRIDQAGGRLLVVTEGLLYYLQPEDVAALARELRGMASLQLWLCDVMGAATMHLMRLMWRRAMGSAQFHFGPRDVVQTFAGWGFAPAERREVLLEAERLGRAPLGYKLLPDVAGMKGRWVTGQYSVMLLEKSSAAAAG